MGIFDLFKTKNTPVVIAEKPKAQVISANFTNFGSVNYSGEKNVGAVGPVINNVIDYYSFATRSWDLYLKSDLAQTVINRKTVWIIDKGLKLQSMPDRIALESEGIKINTEVFSRLVESRFNIWAKSKHSSFSGMLSFYETNKEAYKNAKVGGDVLVILRLIKGTVKVELIDGRHVQSPFGTGFNSNIKNGVEKDERGMHIAYHVKVNGGFQRISCIDKTTGLRVAFLYYGSKYRLNDDRGLPVMGASLETIAQTDRYKEAAVGSAEERAKIVFQIVHGAISDGTSPFEQQMAKAFSDSDNGDVPQDSVGNTLANNIAATTNKETFNMTPGSELKAISSQAENQYTPFYETNRNIIASANNIPSNVAFSSYTDSFSASRAATKDWEHTITFERDDANNQYLSYVYSFWLHFEVLNGKIQAPGYLSAFNSGNWMVTEAYLNCKFTGPMFPHIDPLKEVKAERAKLGPLGDNLPLTTLEAATEHVGSGESTSNLEQFSREMKEAEGLDITEKVSEVASS